MAVAQPHRLAGGGGRLKRASHSVEPSPGPKCGTDEECSGGREAMSRNAAGVRIYKGVRKTRETTDLLV